MEHLNAETLARLVDHTSEPEESAHVAECEACSAELAALRSQTEALGSLPEIRPPQGDWPPLEARLRSEGLIEDAGLFRKMGLAQTPGWMRATAAIMLFLSGTGAGAVLNARGAPQPLGELAMRAGPTSFASSANVEDAASAVRLAEQNYVTAFARYQELLISESGIEAGFDPMSRYAALEHMVAVSQAAVRQAPGDSFLNGVLVSVLGEREATARLVASQNDWFDGRESTTQLVASRSNWF
jgi:hypothetical protein